VISYINLVTTVCVNALVTLNTAPNSVTKGEKLVRNLAFLLGICLLVYFLINLFYKVGRVSVDGIATRYGLGGRKIESRCGQGFLHPSRPALGTPELRYNGYWVFPAVKAAGEYR